MQLISLAFLKLEIVNKQSVGGVFEEVLTSSFVELRPTAKLCFATPLGLNAIIWQP